MSLPVMGPAQEDTFFYPDPYGLWEPAPAVQGEREELSFSGPEKAPDEQVVAVWRLDLVSADPGAGLAALEQREQQVTAIETRLEEAGLRLDAFLNARGQPGGVGTVAFGVEQANALPAPEAGLAAALAAVEGAAVAGAGAASYGLVDSVTQLVSGIDWNGLQKRFSALMDTINRQLLHAAWVETTLDGRLVARTTINWGGDLSTTLAPALAPATVQAHQASLEQAIASEAANLKTVLTVVQVAVKIALAVTTPLGAAQALALAWQFVREVVSGK